LLEELGEELEGGLEAVPAIPRPTPTSLGKLREQTAAQQSEPAAPKGKGKRAAGRGGRSAAAKKTRGDGAVAPAEDGTAEQEDTEMADGEQADGAAAPRPAGDDARLQAVFSVLDPAELQFPHMPDRKETEQFLLQARKKALREQYIG
jgi:type IV secretory pathway VirB10-like protein